MLIKFYNGEDLVYSYNSSIAPDMTAFVQKSNRIKIPAGTYSIIELTLVLEQTPVLGIIPEKFLKVDVSPAF